jgi:zinc transporter
MIPSDIKLHENHGLLFAYQINREGVAKKVAWEELEKETPSHIVLTWIHLDREKASAWLKKKNYFNELVLGSLLSARTRPRMIKTHSQETILILRALHDSESAEEDLVSLRLLIRDKQLITLSRYPIGALEQTRLQVEKGSEIVSVADCLSALCQNIHDELEREIEALNLSLYEIESIYENHQKVNLDQLNLIQRRSHYLKRYLSPQKILFGGLSHIQLPWVKEHGSYLWHEIENTLTHLIEDLDQIQLQSRTIQEAISNKIDHKIAQSMYIMSIFSAFFLPLTLFTGLLGMNVDGIPRHDTPHAFWWACTTTAGIALIQYLFFKRKKWL